jgi:hypothetical protein
MKRPMIKYHVSIQLSEGIHAQVFVYAPKNAPDYVLAKAAKIKLGILPKKQKRGAKPKHAIQRDEKIQD